MFAGSGQRGVPQVTGEIPPPQGFHPAVRVAESRIGNAALRSPLARNRAGSRQRVGTNTVRMPGTNNGLRLPCHPAARPPSSARQTRRNTTETLHVFVLNIVAFWRFARHKSYVADVDNRLVRLGA